MFGKKEKVKSCSGNHISGLDVPENAVIVFNLYKDRAIFNVTELKKEYSISLDRIQSISFHHETEIEKYTTSSLGSAVVGAAAFGVIGAIIGSRPKTKEKRNISFFLIVEYDNKFIVIESKDGFSVGQVVDYFKKIKPSSGTQRIEL